MSSLNFNSVLLNISGQLSAEQLEDLKFLCKDVIKKRDREAIVSGTKLFQLLEERRLLTEDNTDFLFQLLNKIKRPDLSERLNNRAADLNDKQLDEGERAKLDVATMVIAENLGGRWRKLGRELGLSEPRLGSVGSRHPTDLEETVVELLKEWRKIQGAAASVEKLIKALRVCNFNLTADNVEDRLATAL